MIQAVIFDFNGVLVDDEVVHFELFREVLAQERVVITDRDYHERYLGYVIQNSDVFLYSNKLYFNRLV